MDPLKTYLKISFLFSTLIFFTACIGSSLPRELQKPQVVTTQNLEGVATDSDGNTLNLDDFKNQNVVLMFAQFWCEICKKEAFDVVQSLGAAFKEPINAKLITIVISSNQAKAQIWKETQKVPWVVASTPDNKLLKKFCPEGLTPCTVIQKPQKGVVFVRQGEVTPEEIISFVGPWQFDNYSPKKEISKNVIPKISTGNSELDRVLNDPKNICAPSGTSSGAHGSERKTSPDSNAKK